ncbi:MAG: indolepyruvate ferredoxin oxidoreductase alpha and beta subunit [Conexibacter sp.]|nr:indolepyruvate ferredoxin oxidoreductase alpha and beta subunit [Conexibacter sp.]
MSATLDVVRPHVALDDKYVAESGRVLISGVQALVRLTLEQRRLDRRRGHDTGVFVSGYQGSPLGGVDREMQRAHKLLEPEGIVFHPGLNEELAATAVAGTQLLGQLERRRRDGVVGFWYGKNPGFDRAADALRHGNVSGTAPLGGAVAWIGDDPESKSSTLPSSCEPMCRSLLIPLLAPGTVEELLTFGLHSVALSRASGLWTGMKIVADVADASATVDVGRLLDQIPELPPRDRFEPPIMLPPSNLAAEQDLMTARLTRAHDYARLTQLNRVTSEPARARIAVVAAGTAYQSVLRALEDLGLDADARQKAGLRLVKLGMPWPLERGEVRRLLGDVETVLVVEDKLPFVEMQIKDALYRQPDAPAVLGQEDLEGRPLIPVSGTVVADDVAHALRVVIPEDRLPEGAVERLELIVARVAAGEAPSALPQRTPYFCSGCPHSSSTKADDDQLVGVGIGCHVMVALDTGGRGRLLGMPQMGGEGAQWFGLSHFTDDAHFAQNLGDGTFHHSGSLAIRAAVAARVNMTYKLLYNDAVAMTGGQRPEGRLDVPSLTRWLALEGVQKIVVTTPDPQAYAGVTLDPIATVRHRDESEAVQHELRDTPGVTVLVHDDRCATEKRRLRKRGELESVAERVWINERVCEGCGDCGEQSTCLSVLPVETEFGRKTHIHQASCNSDMSCLKGDCPSFVMVTPKAGSGDAKARTAPALPLTPPEPARRVGDDVLLRMPGIGGTGVVTISQILQMAAHLDGRFAAGLEQTGLAQKGGPVLSDVRIAATPVSGQLRAAAGSADVLLGLDLLGAAAKPTLTAADPSRTIAIVNTAAVATAAMVTDTRVTMPSERIALRRIEAATKAGENLYLDARDLAERLFGDHMPANMLIVGAAYQHGCLPLTAAAIERAIELNGAAVDVNLAAFRWGRVAALDLDAVERALAGAAPAALAPAVDRRALAVLEASGADGELRRLLEVRIPELIAFQSVAYAQRYADDVMRVASIERERIGGSHELPVAEAYARGLYKLMAYKDEYEVARLHLDGIERARLESAFGADAKVQIMLHPPLLRALGMNRKLKLGSWVRPGLRALYAARGLRGTRLDPFGYAEVRRVERELVEEYRELVQRALLRLEGGTVDLIREIAEQPDVVRGYEQIKLANVARFRARTGELVEQLESGERAPAEV